MDTFRYRRYPQAHKLPADVQEKLIAGVLRSLDARSDAVERAISVLYARQTYDEKRDETTRHNNSLGVRHNHGRRIAYYGKWIASGRRLTGHHLDFARKIAKTYARTQLFELAALKAGLIKPDDATGRKLVAKSLDRSGMGRNEYKGADFSNGFEARVQDYMRHSGESRENAERVVRNVMAGRCPDGCCGEGC